MADVFFSPNLRAGVPQRSELPAGGERSAGASAHGSRIDQEENCYDARMNRSILDDFPAELTRSREAVRKVFERYGPPTRWKRFEHPDEDESFKSLIRELEKR
jgi:hypothetical protein